MQELGKPTPSPLLPAGLAALVLVLHLPYLTLPFHWDELGQFVPAALDIYRRGLWIPRMTVPNVHPPGVMAALALVWDIVGYSILSARLTMLAIAAAGVILCFRLTLRLSGALAPACAAALLLIASPIFYTQSMMVLLDMPAMTLTLVALLLFLNERYAFCAIVCAGLVLVKETSITTPAVFAIWLWLRRREWKALYFIAPAAALGFWLLALHRVTGHWLGNEEFAQYNVASALEPFHLAFAFASRAWFLFVSDGHWIGTLALIFGWRVLRTPEWKLAIVIAITQVVIVTVFGGAELERYLVPVLPILYGAMATAACVVAPGKQLVGLVAMVALLVLGWFWNPPYTRPYEDNLDMVDFVRTNQDAATYLEQRYPDARIASAWPFTAALRHPEFGYVKRSMNVIEAPGLHLTQLSALGAANFDIAVLFTNKRPSNGRLLNIAPLRIFVRKYYDFAPQATQEEMRTELGLVPIKRWQRGDQWVEIYAPVSPSRDY